MARRTMKNDKLFVRVPDNAPTLSESESEALQKNIDLLSITVKPELDRLERVMKDGQAKLKEMCANSKIVKGSYITCNGGTFTLSTTAAYEDPDPQAVFQYIMDNEMADAFPYVFTVNVTKLKELLGQEIVDNKFRKRKPVDATRMSFK